MPASSERPSLAIGTIIASNYLAFARTLARSLRVHHPSLTLHVLLVDDRGRHGSTPEPFEWIELSEIGIPDLRGFLFSHTRKEAATGAKPHLFRHLLERGFEQVLFLDPDTYVVGCLDALFDHVEQHAITLTPHLVEPLAGADRIARELNILVSGAFNGGCVGVSDSPEARRALDWWAARLNEHYWCDVARGIFYDQRWLDLLPSFFEVGILRDPRFNVAHWNLPERGDLDVRLLHFSGFDPENADVVTAHSPRLAVADVGQLASWFGRYGTALGDAGHRDTRRLGYAYAHFANGSEISEEARLCYRELGKSAERFGDPFDTASITSFARWLEERR